MKLLGAIARRTGYSVLVVLGVLIAIFLMSEGIGDPAILMAGPEAPADLVDSIRRQYGFDDPLTVRFTRSLTGWLRGDFGQSFWQLEPAFGIVLRRFPTTIYLTVATLLFAVPLGLLLGLAAARWQGSQLDRVINFVALAGVSVANFWLALMLILVVAVGFRLLPTSGVGGPSAYVLPAISIGMRGLGRVTQLTRSSLLLEWSKPYVVTARSKGLTEWDTITRHTFPNSAIPLVTLGGDELHYLLGGVVVVETVFGIPGLGGLLIQAINHRDVPLVEATAALIAVSVVVVNLLVDLSYYVLDPRIRRG